MNKQNIQSNIINDYILERYDLLMIEIIYPEWIEQAEDLYKKGISFTKIGEILQVNRKLVSYYLQKKGYIPNHKYISKSYVVQKTKKEIDDNIFEIIDTEEKAYWLGFLYADGCVYEKNNGIELGLKESDYIHLVKFKNFLKSEHKICKKSKIMNGKEYIGYRIHFSSKKMKSDLIQKGCIPNKTYFLNFPTYDIVPKYLMKHFIRGYLEGDGCIVNNKNKKVSVELIGTEQFLLGVTKFLNIEGHIYEFCPPKKYDKKFSISGIKAMKILHFLYDDATIYLDRKYILFQKFAQLYSNI